MREQFERSILEAPDDAANYAVFGDWLQEQGDPRGEFIQVQLALEDADRDAAQRNQLQAREQELLAAHREEWLGPFAPLVIPNPIVMDSETLENRPNYAYRFERGFLAALHIHALNTSMLQALIASPDTPFLRELVIESYDYEDQDREGLDESLLADFPEFHCLKRFRFGSEVDVDAFLQSPYGAQCHAYCPPAADLVQNMPAIEQLDLLCKSIDVEKLFALETLSHLKSLRIYHLGVYGPEGERARYAYPLDVLAANPALGHLTHLLFHPHHEEYHTDEYGQDHLPSFLPLEQVEALVKSPHLPNLTHLQLRLCNMGNDGCRLLVETGVLRRLKWLDLRHGCITDEGARILAASPDLARLEHLDLSRNGLSEEGIAVLRETGVALHAEAQQSDEELAQEQYLYEGDSE